MKKTFLFSFICFLFTVFLLPTMSFAEKSYINGIDANYPPFGYVDAKGNPSGFDVDSMNWIANKMGFTVTHQPMDWDGIIPALVANKIDMVCSGMSVSPERQKRVTFSDPYWTIRKVYLTRADSDLTQDDIVNGKKMVGVQRGTNEAELMQKALENKQANFTLRFYDSGPMAIEDLVNGRIEAVGLDSAPANDAIRKGKPVKLAGDFGVEDNFAVATRHEDAELRKLINEGYKLLMADPYWEELQNKYLK